MAQRVYRQIKSVSPDVGVTIATGEDQVSTIKTSLVMLISASSHADVIHFPAIVLAATYLHDIKALVYLKA